MSRYISANLGLLEQLEEDDGEKEDWSAGLDGVEPEIGLLNWTGELDQLVSPVLERVKETKKRASGLRRRTVV